MPKQVETSIDCLESAMGCDDNNRKTKKAPFIRRTVLVLMLIMLCTILVGYNIVSPVNGMPSAQLRGVGNPLLRNFALLEHLFVEDSLAWQKPPKRLAIVLPFCSKDAALVIAAVRRWSSLGDPCAVTRRLKTKPASVLFWFHRDFFDPSNALFRKDFQQKIDKAIEPIKHCFNDIIYDSAYLADYDDVYPRGPTRQFYNLFTSELQPLQAFDYIFWHEHDVQPIRSGWIDALLFEVTYNDNFFVKGSLHRGTKLDDNTNNDGKSWINHINGNALYKCNDPQFNAMISELAISSASTPPDDFLASFDLAIWIRFVTSYAMTWVEYKEVAHMFQYSDFIQSYCAEISTEQLQLILRNSPSTYFLHGSAAAAGNHLYQSQT